MITRACQRSFHNELKSYDLITSVIKIQESMRPLSKARVPLRLMSRLPLHLPLQLPLRLPFRLPLRLSLYLPLRLPVRLSMRALVAGTVFLGVSFPLATAWLVESAYSSETALTSRPPIQTPIACRHGIWTRLSWFSISSLMTYLLLSNL